MRSLDINTLRLGLAASITALISLGLGACDNGSSGSNSVQPDTNAPQLISLSPADGAVDVDVRTVLTATFGEPMDISNLSEVTFTLTGPDSVPVGGIVTHDATHTIATFEPTSTLATGTTFTAMITTDVKDAAGNPLPQDLVWTFTTAGPQDITPPTIASTNPAAGAGNVTVTSTISVTFSEAMLASTITPANFTIAGVVASTVTYNAVSRVATYTPSSSLAPNTTFTATIGIGVRDLAGNALASSFVWTFTTAGAPTVSTTNPASGARDVPINSSINVTFSEAMTPSTITPANFTVAGITAVTVTYDVASRIATYTPNVNLASNTTFTATIHTGVKDVAGNAMAANFVWSFTTAAVQDLTSPTVTATTPADLATGFPINGRPTATFSEAMQPLSINPASFTLHDGPTPVTGTVTYADVARIATFAPAVTLTSGTVYTGTITTAVEDLAGNNQLASFVWTFTTAAAPDTTRPTVDTVSPLIGATAAINTMVNAAFSESIDPTTITTATFKLSGPGLTPVTGTVAYVDIVSNRSNATFDPSNDLPAGTTITGTLTTGVKDLAGNALASDFVWTFKTGATPDTTAPTVTATVPTSTAFNVAVNSNMAATFSESMDPSTINQSTFTVASGATITGLVSYVDAGRVATFDPASDLAFNTTYTATVTTGVKDLAGNAKLQSFVWTFTTGAAPDLTPPTVTATNPAHLATNVFINKKVNVTFNEPMNPTTISTFTYRLAEGAGLTPVQGTIQIDPQGQIATFVPTANLTAFTQFTATITTGVADLAGNTLTSDFVWTFTTGSGAAQDPVNLSSAGFFAVLAGQTVTNVNNPGTVLNGDLGLSPGDLSSITGFPPGVVNGQIFGGPAAAQAKVDLTTGFNDAMARSTGAQTLEGNLGGLTKTPGLYSNSSTSGISGTGPNAIFTLDAQGDATAVFIFKISSTFITDSGTSIVLAGGANANNVYFSVGTSATLGTNSIFYGNILASESITLTTGATLNGRALAQNGAVTLDTNTITVPAP